MSYNTYTCKYVNVYMHKISTQHVGRARIERYERRTGRQEGRRGRTRRKERRKEVVLPLAIGLVSIDDQASFVREVPKRKEVR
jgi:hypothetical protein